MRWVKRTCGDSIVPEEVKTNDALLGLGLGTNDVNVNRGGVGSQQRMLKFAEISNKSLENNNDSKNNNTYLWTVLLEIYKDLLLQRDVFKHRLNSAVHIAKVLVGYGQLHGLVHDAIERLLRQCTTLDPTLEET